MHLLANLNTNKEIATSYKPLNISYTFWPVIIHH